MLRHADIWHAIDRLAFKHGLTASGLARKAGLDPTTFNKSKRTSPEGKLRWPSTESVAKVLAATSATLGEFIAMIDNPNETGAIQRIPLIGLAQAGSQGYFDDAGYPTGSGWDEIPFPEMGDARAYASEIAGNSMEPLYREGDIIIVSPAAQIRRSDRVVVKTSEGEVMVKQLTRRTAKAVDLQSLNPQHPNRSIPLEEIVLIHRVVWASQ